MYSTSNVMRQYLLKIQQLNVFHQCCRGYAGPLQQLKSMENVKRSMGWPLLLRPPWFRPPYITHNCTASMNGCEGHYPFSLVKRSELLFSLFLWGLQERSPNRCGSVETAVYWGPAVRIYNLFLSMDKWKRFCFRTCITWNVEHNSFMMASPASLTGTCCT